MHRKEEVVCEKSRAATYQFSVIWERYFQFRSEGGTKVPFVITAWFWIMKLLVTTIGKTISDLFRNIFELPCVAVTTPSNCNEQKALGLNAALFVPIFLTALYFQLKCRTYKPTLYWLVAGLCAIVGTTFADGLNDNGLPLWGCCIVFFLIMLAGFAVWYRTQGTIEIHSIDRTSRECFYWLTIVWTYSLGTSLSDTVVLLVLYPSIGYSSFYISLAIFLGTIIALATFWRIAKYGDLIQKAGLIEIGIFWSVYVVTRPLGATIGDIFCNAIGCLYSSIMLLFIAAGVLYYLEYTGLDKTPIDNTSNDAVDNVSAFKENEDSKL